MSGQQIRRLDRSKLSHFHLLDDNDYIVTSDETGDYNCAGWAIDQDCLGNWWPDPDTDRYHWPDGGRRDGTLGAMKEGFALLGFTECLREADDPDFLKIVIYVLRGMPKHVAWQLPDGRWASKLGDWEDIEHTDPMDLARGSYGDPEIYMRKPLALY